MAKHKNNDMVLQLETVRAMINVLGQRIDDLTQTVAATREAVGLRVDGLEKEIHCGGQQVTITIGNKGELK